MTTEPEGHGRGPLPRIAKGRNLNKSWFSSRVGPGKDSSYIKKLWEGERDNWTRRWIAEVVEDLDSVKQLSREELLDLILWR